MAAATFNVPAFIVKASDSTRSKIEGVVFLCHLTITSIIMLAQGTCALELEEQFMGKRQDECDDGLDAVLAPSGGGGRLGSIAVWFGRNLQPESLEPSFHSREQIMRDEDCCKTQALKMLRLRRS